MGTRTASAAPRRIAKMIRERIEARRRAPVAAWRFRRPAFNCRGASSLAADAPSRL